MFDLSNVDIKKHRKIAGWLMIGLYASLVFEAIIVAVVCAILQGHFNNNSQGITFFKLVGTLFPIVLMIEAIPGIVAGVTILKGKATMRTLQWGMGAIAYLHFPIGTAIGVYTLWVLNHKPAKGTGQVLDGNIRNNEGFSQYD